IEPVAGFGNNRQGSSRLHQEIARIGLREWVAKRIATTLPDDDDVGSAGLLDDKSCRKILRTAPFHGRSAVLHRRPKLRFEFGDAVSDRCLTLIEDLLGLPSVREIKRRTEFGCGNSDHMATKPLGPPPRHLHPVL